MPTSLSKLAPHRDVGSFLQLHLMVADCIFLEVFQYLLNKFSHSFSETVAIMLAT